MIPFRVRTHAALAALAVVALGGCTDHGPEVLTQDLETSAASGILVSASRGPASAERLAFVSSLPGSLARGTTVRIRSGDAAATPVISDGGFDPVAVPAGAGEPVYVEISDGAGGMVSSAAVPLPFPPIVVRTDPPKRRTSVPLNTKVTIVFSEPIAQASVTSTTVRLRHDSTEVPAALSLHEDWTVVEVAPTAPLLGLTVYTLEITTGITDLDGQHLEESVTVVFQTAEETAEAWELRRDTLRLQVGGDWPLTLFGPSYPPPRATWSVDDTSVATVAVYDPPFPDVPQSVLLRAAAIGETTVRARFADDSEVSATVVVTEPGTLGSISLDPATPTVAVGDTVTFTIFAQPFSVVNAAFGGEGPSWTVRSTARVIEPVRAPTPPPAASRWVALEPGTAYVTVRVGSLTAEAEVTIVP